MRQLRMNSKLIVFYERGCFTRWRDYQYGFSQREVFEKLGGALILFVFGKHDEQGISVLHRMKNVFAYRSVNMNAFHICDKRGHFGVRVYVES